ncbi:MAG: hypothetical protein JNM72_18730 [Deltaproteobacteria bacterium]|nr:hypothetical protein [Deltaproteobacteria bacterium]
MLSRVTLVLLLTFARPAWAQPAPAAPATATSAAASGAAAGAAAPVEVAKVVYALAPAQGLRWPGAEARSLPVEAGARLEIIAEDGDLIRVREGTRFGWLPRAAVTSTPPAPAAAPGLPPAPMVPGAPAAPAIPAAPTP